MSGPAEWAARASTAEFWFVTIILSVFAVVGLVAFLMGYRRVRMIRDIPTARVRSAPQGYVELKGSARTNGPALIPAPLTATPCLWFEYKVERKRRSGKRTSWSTVRKGRSDESFFLDDGTGRCVIFPEGAEVTPEVEQVWYGATEHPGRPPSGSASTHSIGGFRLEVSGFSFGTRRYRFTEKRIHDGDPLYGIGWFETVTPGSETTLAEETRDELSALKRDRKTLLARFDVDRDGEIDLAEWDAARDAVQREVVAARAERSATESAVHTLMKPPERRQPFLLSTHPESKLVGHYRTMAWVGGVFLAGFGSFVAWIVTIRN